MGKINLGRERGVNPIGSAQHGATSPRGYEILSTGISNQARASDNLAKGIAHLGSVMSDISHNMAETRNAVDMSDYQLQAFKINKTELIDKMEADMMSGKINSKESFDASYKKYSQSAQKKCADFAGKQGYAPSVFDKISIFNKRLEADDFARLSGRFVHYENKRVWDKTENILIESASMGYSGIENIKLAVNNLRGKYSPEVCDALEKKYTNLAIGNEFESFKARMRFAVSPEAVKKIVAENEDLYGGLNKNQRLEFDIFASAQYEQAMRNEQKAQQSLKKLNQEKIEDFKEGSLIDVGNNIRRMAENYKRVISAQADIKDKRLQLEAICSKYGADEAFTKAILNDFDNEALKLENDIPIQVQKHFYKRTVDVLAEAVEQNDTDIDINVLSGGNPKYAKELLEQKANIEAAKIAKIRAELKDNPNAYPYKNGKSEERELLIEYNAKYNEALGDILSYDKDLDPYGQKLASIMVKAQSFAKQDQADFMRLLYNKAVKNEDAPAKWNKADIDLFEKEFKTFFKWAGDEDSSSEYLQMRARVMSIARLKGLSAQEAVIEMKNDDFYKRSEIEQNRKILKKALGVR